MSMMEYLENEKVRMEMMMKMNDLQEGIADIDIRLAKPGRGVVKMGREREGGITKKWRLFELKICSQIFPINRALFVRRTHFSRLKKGSTNPSHRPAHPHRSAFVTLYSQV